MRRGWEEQELVDRLGKGLELDQGDDDKDSGGDQENLNSDEGAKRTSWDWVKLRRTPARSKMMARAGAHDTDHITKGGVG